MGFGSSKRPVPGPDNEFLQAEARRKVKPHKILKDHFDELARLDPRVPRDEKALEVVLRIFQEAAESSQDAANAAQKAAEEANVLVQEVGEKLCPRISKAVQDLQAKIADLGPQMNDQSKESQRLEGIKQMIKQEEENCRALVSGLEPLVVQQRKAAAILVTAYHKQQVGANAAVQALLNPMVGLNPRKYKAYPDEGIRKKRPDPTVQCHMECAKVRPPVVWPFDNDPAQQAREGAGDEGAPQDDPAVGRLRVLDPRSQAVVKNMLGRQFL